MSRTALYRLYSAEGALVYVGISLSAFRRLSQHSREKSWWPQVEHITVMHYPDWDSAAEAEARAIADEFPLCNIRGRS